MTPIELSVQQAVDHVFARLAESGYRSLNAAQRTLVCVWGAVGEVDNGGLEQFFFNTSGDWSRDTADAFRAVGVPALAAVMEQALAIFPDSEPSPDLHTRREQLETLPQTAQDRLAALDGAFYDAASTIDARLAAFVQAQRQQLLALEGA